MKKKTRAALAAVLFLALILSGKVRAADRRPIQAILEGCCLGATVEVRGTVAPYPSAAGRGQDLYYLKDDSGRVIAVRTLQKSGLEPGRAATVTGTVSRDQARGYYLAEQSRQVGEWPGQRLRGPFIYLFIAIAAAVLGLVVVMVLFLKSPRRAGGEAGREGQGPGKMEAGSEALAGSGAAGDGAASSPLAPRYRKAWLKVVEGPGLGATWPLSAPRTALGRAEDNDILLLDERVSHQHARIEVEDGVYFLQDLGSTNGTFLNGNRLSARAALIHNYRIRLGRIELAFLAEV